VARYEELRAAVLGGGPGGGHGLALLAAQGMAAWIVAWRPLRAPDLPVAAPARRVPEGVVAVLASMAAACLVGG
jgi:hypothetical protein